jgi:NADH-quinone oxidoreductase subunit M
LPITPDASHELAWLMITLSLIAVVYIGFVALVQADMKKLIAYSSIAHMGFVTLGFFVIFAATPASLVNDGARMALQGGMMQMLSHGLISGALFLCVGVLYDRMHSREISAYGGVINTMPKFAALMVLFGLANAGLPGTSGFVGEFFVILGTFQANPWLAFLAATTLVLGAAYTLWMIKRVVFGDVANSHVAALTDVGAREFWMLMVLAIAVLIVGVWPAPIVDRMDASIGQLLMHVGQPKL